MKWFGVSLVGALLCLGSMSWAEDDDQDVPSLLNPATAFAELEQLSASLGGGMSESMMRGRVDHILKHHALRPFQFNEVNKVKQRAATIGKTTALVKAFGAKRVLAWHPSIAEYVLGWCKLSYVRSLRRRYETPDNSVLFKNADLQSQIRKLSMDREELNAYLIFGTFFGGVGGFLGAINEGVIPPHLPEDVLVRGLLFSGAASGVFAHALFNDYEQRIRIPRARKRIKQSTEALGAQLSAASRALMRGGQCADLLVEASPAFQ